MEATQKTSITKAALLVIAALSMLLSGLFVATASRSDASPPAACPDGFSLTADEKNCFQAAVKTTADNPNSCEKGLLTPDGSKCYVAAKVITQEGQTFCPEGYSPDDSLNAMCSKFGPAKQGDPTCADTARGSVGACFIYVAKGPAGALTCATGAVLTGTQCVTTGAPPVLGNGTCPVSDTVFEDASGCFTLTLAQQPPAPCGNSGYTFFPVGSICKLSNPNEGDPVLGFNFTCPADVGGAAVTAEMSATVFNAAGVAKTSACTFVGVVGTVSCPSGSTGPDAQGQCRRPQNLTGATKSCPDPSFAVIGNDCVKSTNAITADGSCPAGSFEDSEGACRKPVADKSGAYFCENAAAALNGKVCVLTTGFLVKPSPNLYKCDEGDRTIIGPGGSAQVICILGDALTNQTSAETCLQGVLSTDKQYCIVPRIDAAPAVAVAAPVPSFTG